MHGTNIKNSLQSLRSIVTAVANIVFRKPITRIVDYDVKKSPRAWFSFSFRRSKASLSLL
jgi:hypothetical protein